MLDTMFELPGMPEVTGCVIDEAAVNGGSKPKLVEGIQRKSRRRKGAEETEQQEAESSVS